jgi:hypothetical protein
LNISTVLAMETDCTISLPQVGQLGITSVSTLPQLAQVRGSLVPQYGQDCHQVSTTSWQWGHSDTLLTEQLARSGRSLSHSSRMKKSEWRYR